MGMYAYPLGPIAFIFMQFLPKKLPSNRLAQPPPPVGNPGYVTVILKYSFVLLI